MKTAKRWCIQVVFRSGAIGYLRHGGRIGFGPIVMFTTRKLADINVELVKPGLDGAAIFVVPFPPTVAASCLIERTPNRNRPPRQKTPAPKAKRTARTPDATSSKSANPSSSTTRENSSGSSSAAAATSNEPDDD